MISSIYRLGPVQPTSNSVAARRNAVAYQEAWLLHGLACIKPDTIEDDWLQRHLINEMEKRYGKRAGA